MESKGRRARYVVALYRCGVCEERARSDMVYRTDSEVDKEVETQGVGSGEGEIGSVLVGDWTS